MANNSTLEFILKLKDMMSGGMRNAATTAQNALGAVDRKVSAVQRSMNHTGRSASSLSRRLDDLQRTRNLSINKKDIIAANRQIDLVERKLERINNLGRRRSGGGLMAAGIAGFGLTALLTAGAANVANAGLQAGAQQTSFEVLAGEQKGKQLYTNLTKFAQDSIFGNEVYKNSQTMLAFGVSVDKVLPRLKMLGDISMGNKERLSSLTLAYAQNQAAGRLMGQDLLQMVNAGFNPLMEISEMTGISMGKLKEYMEKGAISSAMVTKAFEHATSRGGKFFNMTERIANTPFGKWEALKGQIQGVSLQLGTALAPAIGDFIAQYAVPFITWLSQSVMWLQQNWYWVKHLAMILLTVRLAFMAYSTAVRIATWANTMFNLSLNATPLGRIIAGITALISLFGLLSASTAHAMGDYKSTVSDAATSAITSDEITETYANAGEEHGAAYAKAVSRYMKSIAATQLKNDVAEIAMQMGKGMNTAESLATFLNKPAQAKLTLDAGLRMPTFQEQASFLTKQLPSVLKQAGLGGGKDAFAELAQQAREQASVLKKMGIDVTGKVEGIIKKSYSGLVAMAESGKVPTGGGNAAGISSDDFSSLSNTNSRISRSGPKVINITFNSPLVEGNTVVVDNKEAAKEFFDDRVAEAVLRALDVHSKDEG